MARKAGVEKHIHPHTYRRSMATFLRNRGVPLDVVQLLLGHSDPRTTQLFCAAVLGDRQSGIRLAMSAVPGMSSRPTS